MSKYKIEFYSGTIEEIVDLIDDWNYSEEEAIEFFNSEEKQDEAFNEWLADNSDTGYRVFEDEEDDSNE